MTQKNKAVKERGLRLEPGVSAPWPSPGPPIGAPGSRFESLRRGGLERAPGHASFRWHHIYIGAQMLRLDQPVSLNLASSRIMSGEIQAKSNG